FAEKTGIVIELKYPEKGNLDAGCRKAMEQIEAKNYAEQLRNDGMQKIIKCGIACYGKECKVMFEEEIPQR
ncbi:MAG TPA: PD-(D/E)XK nuclease domain-containing protein, partial [Candidatus Mediterraneibacter caccavium]|nr:PD-(D/E)XK nuclease domain-containing protein [Candidatus Mediterraneibacter caccavium]